jgi:hypothetical protein
LAQRDSYSTVADLSRLNAAYTLHGIGTCKSIIRDRRDVVVRFMRAYLEGIYQFKTNKELTLNSLKKYARLSDMSVMNRICDYRKRL